MKQIKFKHGDGTTEYCPYRIEEKKLRFPDRIITGVRVYSKINFFLENFLLDPQDERFQWDKKGLTKKSKV